MTAIVGEPAMEQASDSSSTKWRNFWLLLFAASVPTLIPYFYEMWGSENDRQWYRYFPFVFVAVIALVHGRWDKRFYPPRTSLHWSMVAVGLVLLFASALLQFPWFAAVGFFLIASVCVTVMRGPRDSSLIVLAVPLMMLVQLPFNTGKELVLYLQRITTFLASVMLDFCGAPHAVSGNSIQLSERNLFVAEACSGIQSVFTLAFLACLLIAFYRRRIWLVPIYLVISLILAVSANVIRVTIVALGDVWFEHDLATGWRHEMVGYFALTIAVGFMLSFDQLIVTMLHRVAEVSEDNPIVRGWNSLALRDADGMKVSAGSEYRSAYDSYDAADENENEKTTSFWRSRASDILSSKAVGQAFAVVTVLIAGFGAVQVWRSEKPESFVTSSKAVIFEPSISMLDDSLDYLSINGHEATRGFANPRLGANSDIWHCGTRDFQAQIVLSQPHVGWHELCDCYERLNWTLLDRDLTEIEGASSVGVLDQEPDEIETEVIGEIPYVFARFKKPVQIQGQTQHQYGYLLFAGIGSDGAPITSPSSLSAFTHRVWNRIDTTGVWEQNEVIMLQMWVVSPRKLDPESLANLKEDFIQTRSTVVSEIKQQRSGSKTSVASRPTTSEALAFVNLDKSNPNQR